MNVAATVAAEELHVCSRVASSHGRLKLQFGATTRTRARIDIGRLHRARKTRGGSDCLVSSRQVFVMPQWIKSRLFSDTRASDGDFKAQWARCER